jgi:hypothetical protein
MNRGIRCCLTAAVLVAALGAAEPIPKITVLIYNYAAIPPGLLAQTEAEAARIYQHCRIEFRWLDCPLRSEEVDRFPACKIPSGPTWLALRILLSPMAKYAQAPEESLGFALHSDEGSFAITANVFAHDVEQLAHTYGIPEGVILGHVMAHELGHLLLGPESHSDNGIMQATWHLKELKIIAQGLMMFTPAEAERLRTNIPNRFAEQRFAQAASIPRL